MPRTIWYPLLALMVVCAATAWIARPRLTRALTEAELRRSLGVDADFEVHYRNLQCTRVSFDEFMRGLQAWRTFQSRTFDPEGRSVTVTVARKGHGRCPFPYPRVVQMPQLDARDLDGERVTSAALRGRYTLVTFFFATCPTCRREVTSLNALAARHPDINMLAVTYETPEVARSFVAEQGFNWRVVPDEPGFIRSAGVYVYPTVILFAPDGRALARLTGGVKDAHDERSRELGLRRWLTDSLTRADRGA